MQEILSYTFTLVTPFLLLTLTFFVKPLISAAISYLLAKLDEKHQTTIYNAVKIAERYAASAGYTWHGLEEKIKAAAIDAAIKYAAPYGIQLDPAVLEPLIAAESKKQVRIEQQLVLPLTESFTPPAADEV